MASIDSGGHMQAQYHGATEQNICHGQLPHRPLVPEAPSRDWRITMIGSLL
jgi:hypothetical protein